MSSKAKRDGRIKSDIVIVGIDVAKRRHVAAIRFPDGGIKKPFSFRNDRQGFERLIGCAERARAVPSAPALRRARSCFTARTYCQTTPFTPRLIRPICQLSSPSAASCCWMLSA